MTRYKQPNTVTTKPNILYKETYLPVRGENVPYKPFFGKIPQRNLWVPIGMGE